MKMEELGPEALTYEADGITLLISVSHGGPAWGVSLPSDMLGKGYSGLCEIAAYLAAAANEKAERMRKEGTTPSKDRVKRGSPRDKLELLFLEFGHSAQDKRVNTWNAFWSEYDCQHAAKDAAFEAMREAVNEDSVREILQGYAYCDDGYDGPDNQGCALCMEVQAVFDALALADAVAPTSTPEQEEDDGNRSLDTHRAHCADRGVRRAGR